MQNKTLIVITGPTASGKSALAVELALKLHTEIISADSRQIYQNIPIVTAQPSAEELSAVAHHLVNFLSLDKYYSAAQFADDALAIAQKIWKKNDYAILCGGSMMYIDAVCDGIDDLPTIPYSIRENLKRQHAQYGDSWLLACLNQLDPEYYEKVDKKNIKRVFHAVEIIQASGATYTSLRKGVKKKHPFNVIKIAIDYPREKLFERINLRVDKMVEMGLEDELRAVYPLRDFNSLNTVGAKEMFAFFDGIMDRTTAIERIKKNTRVYAKKQLTWLKRKDDVIYLDATDTNLLNRALDIINS